MSSASIRMMLGLVDWWGVSGTYTFFLAFGLWSLAFGSRSLGSIDPPSARPDDTENFVRWWVHSGRSALEG